MVSLPERNGDSLSSICFVFLFTAQNTGSGGQGSMSVSVPNLTSSRQEPMSLLESFANLASRNFGCNNKSATTTASNLLRALSCNRPTPGESLVRWWWKFAYLLGITVKFHLFSAVLEVAISTLNSTTGVTFKLLQVCSLKFCLFFLQIICWVQRRVFPTWIILVTLQVEVIPTLDRDSQVCCLWVRLWLSHSLTQVTARLTS